MAKVRDAVGLDIGSSGVRAAHLSFAKHPPALENFGQVFLPPDIVRDGEIVDTTTVGRAIAELWKNAGFKRKSVSLGLANQKVVARPIDLPFMEEQELRGALQFQVQEYIPIPVDDAVLDFQILDEFVTENNERMMRVLLVAAQKDMVHTYVEAIDKAGLSLDSIDFIPLALIRSMGETSDSLSRPAGMGEAIIDVGSGVTTVVVHEAGIPRFARVLSIGGSTLTEALAAGLGVSYEDAESIKQRLGLAATPGEVSATPDPSQPASAGVGDQPGDVAGRILEQRAIAFLEEIRGSLQYYAAQTDATHISRIVLTGGGSKLTNLGPRLSSLLRVPVEAGRTLQKLRLGKVRLTESQLVEAEPLMAAAVGIAMGALWQ